MTDQGPIEPSEDQLRELGGIAGSDADGPVVMLNLNRYRDPEAYLRYGAAALQVLEKVGGKVLWHSQATGVSVGTADDEWDEVIAVWYPSVAAFVAFATDADALAAFPDRRAGLERAAIIRCSAAAEPVLTTP